VNFLIKSFLFFSVIIVFSAIIPGGVQATIKTWDGGGVSNDWSTAANWSGDTVPVTTDAVIFDSTSTKNVTMDAMGTWLGGAFNINSGYTGIITQAVAFTAGAFTQATGTFTGASQAIMVSSFTLSGGTFNSTSTILHDTGSFIISGSPTFTHNSGTVIFDGLANANATIDAPGVIFSKVTVNKSGGVTVNNATFTLTIVSGTTLPLGNSSTFTFSNGGTYGDTTTNIVNNGTLTVETGTLTLTPRGNFYGTFTNNGTITANSITGFTVKGEFINNGTASMTSMTTGIDINGNFTNNANSTWLTGVNPTMTVSGNFTVNSASVFPTNATVTFDGPANANTTIDASGVSFNQVTINKSGGIAYFGSATFTIVSGTTLPLGNSPTLTFSNSGSYGIFVTDIVNNGILTMGTGTLTVTPNGTFTNNSTITANSITAWTMNGNFINNGITSMNNLVSPITINGNFTNNGGKTWSTGTNPTMTVSGNFTVNSASIFPANVSVNFTDLITDPSTKTFAGGGKTYKNMLVNGAGTRTVFFTGANTFENFTIIAPRTVTFPSSTTTTINAEFIAVGSLGKIITINASSLGTQAMLSKSSGIVNADYLSLRDSGAIGGATWYAGTHSTDGGNNSGWLFTSPPTYFLGIVIVGTGSVISSPIGINCGGDCNEYYASGTVVTLTAIEGAGSVFIGWTGLGCSGVGTCIVTMDADKAFIATFDTALIDNSPTADNLAITSQDNCIDSPNTLYIFGWNYNDVDGNNENQFQFQISDDPTFLTTAVDRLESGLNNPPGTYNSQAVNVQLTGSDSLRYGTTYYWRVKVWETDPSLPGNPGLDSGWIEGSSFTTPPYPWPKASFTFTQGTPTIYDVVFTNTSVCYNDGGSPVDCGSYLWNFGDAASSQNTSTLQNPSHTYSGLGDFTVTLIANDAVPDFTCQISSDISIADNVQNFVRSLPIWKEISPFLINILGD